MGIIPKYPRILSSSRDWGDEVEVDAYICEECLTDFKLHLDAIWPVLFKFAPDRPFKSHIVCGQARARLVPRLGPTCCLMLRITLRQAQPALG
jgi:hypothetical protein